MGNTRIVLIGLGAPLCGALRTWCAERSLSLLELRDASALPSLEGSGPLVCVLALRSDREASPDRIRSLRKWLATSPLIVVACGIGIDCAVRLIRSGVADVVEANQSPEEVVARIARHVGRQQVDEVLAGSSPAMRRLREEIAAVAELSSSVLLKGEAGVGKGSVARAIHRLSRRRNGPFVHVDSASLPAASVAQEIFGGSAGNGPNEDRGSLGAAAGGTLYLDEIADLCPEIQVRLLGLLEDQESHGIARIQSGPSPVRLIAATTRDLHECVRRGQFRADLYFRLEVFPIFIPPLRERLADLDELVRAGLEVLGERLGVTAPQLSPAVYRAMAEHAWPGNVRELLSLLERALVRHHGGLFDEKQLIEALGHAEGPCERAGGEEGSPISRAAVANALVATGGNIARAARRLGVPRTTLRYRISVLGLDSILPRD